jgi:hypothetical protein
MDNLPDGSHVPGLPRHADRAAGRLDAFGQSDLPG